MNEWIQSGNEGILHHKTDPEAESCKCVMVVVVGSREGGVTGVGHLLTKWREEGREMRTEGGGDQLRQPEAFGRPKVMFFFLGVCGIVSRAWTLRPSRPLNAPSVFQQDVLRLDSGCSIKRAGSSQAGRVQLSSPSVRGPRREQAA